MTEELVYKTYESEMDAANTWDEACAADARYQEAMRNYRTNKGNDND